MARNKWTSQQLKKLGKKTGRQKKSGSGDETLFQPAESSLPEALRPFVEESFGGTAPETAPAIIRTAGERVGPEHRLAARIANYLRALQLQAQADGTIPPVFHFDIQGQYQPFDAPKRRVKELKNGRGFPDLQIILASRIVFIELKAELSKCVDKTGTAFHPTVEHQVEYLNSLSALGHTAVFAWSLEMVQEALASEKILSPAWSLERAQKEKEEKKNKKR